WEVDAELSEPRAAMGLVADGGVLFVAGGVEASGEDASAPTAVAQRFDPLARAWCALAVMDHYIYAAGGYSPEGVLLKSVERYDAAGDTWEEVGSMEQGRAGHQMVVVPTNRGLKLCCVGGTAVGYDAEKNEWEECADFHLPEPLAGFSLCSL
ncbi:hypothetical protein T484DRAFT_1819051, partial [Baffinella frigidus]